MDNSDDQIVSTLPIHFSNSLFPKVQIHQFPLLTRPLQAPPSAIASGKRITARIKPNVRRLEVHVPADNRPEVCSSERSKALGAARVEDDREKNQDPTKGKEREDDPRLNEVRMRSEEIPQRGVHMLGIVRDGWLLLYAFPVILFNVIMLGQLHLHPISETHQFRPTLTYLDVLSRKNKRRTGTGSDSDSDDGPPPDPDEPAPVPVTKKERKPAGETREVQVTARKAEDKGGMSGVSGGLSVVRREMLIAIRAEEDEDWKNLQFCDVTVCKFYIFF